LYQFPNNVFPHKKKKEKETLSMISNRILHSCRK